MNLSLDLSPIEIAIPAYVSVGGFASWHFELSQQWMEIGLRIHDLMNVGFRDWSAIKRFDGEEIGGELQGRQIFLYLRAGLSD